MSLHKEYVLFFHPLLFKYILDVVFTNQTSKSLMFQVRYTYIKINRCISIQERNTPLSVQAAFRSTMPQSTHFLNYFYYFILHTYINLLMFTILIRCWGRETPACYPRWTQRGAIMLDIWISHRMYNIIMKSLIERI